MGVGDRYNEIPSYDRPRKCRRCTRAQNRSRPSSAKDSSSCRAGIDGKELRKLFLASVVSTAARLLFPPRQQVWVRQSPRQIRTFGELGKTLGPQSTQPRRDLPM